MSKVPAQILQLQQEKQQLINRLKTNFTEIYNWLKNKGVDLNTLGKYAKSLGAITVLSISMSYAPMMFKNNVTPSDQKEMHVIKVSSDQLTKLSKEEFRALKVWNMYSKDIDYAANKYNVDKKVIFATIMVESGGNPAAIRYEPRLNDASYGLGQILYGTALHIGFEGKAQDLYKPTENIELIGRYHRWNLDAFGDLTTDKLATAYNAGNPNNYPTYGYLDKFNKWYGIIDKLDQM